VARNSLGRVYLCEGDLSAAAEQFSEALEVNREYKVARYNLAVVHYLSGAKGEALKTCLELADHFPRYSSPSILAGKILEEQGRYGEALLSYERALEICTVSLDVECSIAWLLATVPDPSLRDGVRAASLSENIVDATYGQSRRALDVCAAAYAEQGRFDEAVRVLEKALVLPVQVISEQSSFSPDATMAVDKHSLEAVQARAALYARGIPYRLPPVTTTQGQEQ